jgi:hypothetical protein
MEEEEEYGIQPSILIGVFIWKRRMVYSHSPLYYRSVYMEEDSINPSIYRSVFMEEEDPVYTGVFL